MPATFAGTASTVPASTRTVLTVLVLTRMDSMSRASLSEHSSCWRSLDTVWVLISTKSQHADGYLCLLAGMASTSLGSTSGLRCGVYETPVWARPGSTGSQDGKYIFFPHTHISLFAGTALTRTASTSLEWTRMAMTQVSVSWREGAQFPRRVQGGCQAVRSPAA